MYPAWNKGIMPRCEPVDEVYYEQPGKWSMIEYGYGQWEYQLLDRLSFEKASLFRLWYESLLEREQAFILACFYAKSISQDRIEVG